MSPSRSKLNTHALGTRLNACLFDRDVKTGMRSLDGYFEPGFLLDPNDRQGSALLLALAQWVDLGFRDTAFLEAQFANFKKMPVLDWQVSQYQHIQLTESYLHLARRSYAEAIRLLKAFLVLHGISLSPELSFLSHFWLARAHRGAGDFEQAFQEIRAARGYAD